MIHTEPAKFVVHSVERAHLWLEVLHGGDQGMRVSIPLYHPDHGDEIDGTLHSLDAGDVVEAELYREDQRATWRIDEIATSQ